MREKFTLKEGMKAIVTSKNGFLAEEHSLWEGKMVTIDRDVRVDEGDMIPIKEFREEDVLRSIPYDRLDFDFDFLPNELFEL